MLDARYLIVETGGAWIIRFHDEEFGPYRSEAEAVLFAVDAAKKLEKAGTSAQVFVVGFDGHQRPEWKAQPAA